MMSWILPPHRFERRLAALGWVLRVFLSKNFRGDEKWPTRTNIRSLLRHFVRFALAQSLYPYR